MKSKKDDLFKDPVSNQQKFTFNEHVADVFDDMLNRSVPGYASILYQIGIFAYHYSVDNTNIYDLGCSLGAASLAIKRAVDKNCHIIAVDNSEAMVERCRKSLERDNSKVTYEVILGDIIEQEIKNASVVVLNFTLQFIKPELRNDFIKKIYDHLIPGGILILSEKISYNDQGRTELYDSLYYDFKRANGYSEMEISRKREALEDVLFRDTRETHMERLKSVGFKTVENWFAYLNFNSFLAIK